MKSIKLHIKGMHCKSCEALLEDAFEDLGAKSSTIDHKSGMATIVLDESKVTLDQLKKVVTDEGYSVERVEEL